MKASTVRAGGYNWSANANAAVGTVKLTGKGATFSGSTIAAPTLGTLRLGRVVTANGGQSFGVLTTGGVTRLDAVFGRAAASMSKVNSDADVAAIFAAKKIEPGDFDVTFVS
jgi:hypothetical protein